MLHWKRLIGLVFISSGLAGAHLSDGTLAPKGGETLKVGSLVSVNWKTEENHGKGIDIAFSKDDGSTWTNVKTGFNDNDSVNTFRWTVPVDAVTSKGKIRVCQSGPCKDSQNVTKAGGESPWYLVSGTFTVQASSGIAPMAGAAARGLAVEFHPDTRNVDVSFDLAEGGRVLLQAFDTRGVLVATLMEGSFGPGAHALSVFSNRIGGASASLIFRLQAGDQVKTHAWLTLR